MIPAPAPITIPLREDDLGVIRVGKTRVTLQTVISDFHRGASPEEIVHHYPALDLSDVYLVIGYYLLNREEVDSYVSEQHTLAKGARREFEATYPQDELRARLLAQLEEQRGKSQS